MAISTHKVEVVPVELLQHPNADTLSIVNVFGFTVCVKTDEWKGKWIGAYIQPDSIYNGERIKVKRLRGVVSMGLLVPAPEGSKVGDDVAGILGVTHYEPQLTITMQDENESPPKGYRPVYDVESLRRYRHIFEDGEPVFVTEKIHGASARYCWFDGKMHAGSRTEWKKEKDSNLWWKALKRHPEVIEFCRSNPDITVYGEVYGQVQDLKYGKKQGEVDLAVFDLLMGNSFLSYNEFQNHIREYRLPCVPHIGYGIYSFDFSTIEYLAEGQSLIPGANHVREGVVVKPVIERTHPEIGRVCLKLVGNGYYERKEKR